MNGPSREWWMLLLRGAAAIAFGIVAFAWPGLSLFALVLAFGAFAVADGAFALGAAASGRAQPGTKGWLVALGILGIGAGIVAVLWPGLTAFALLVIIATWAILAGVLEIAGAIRLRKVISNEWMLMLAGVLSILFGVLLLARPGAGALAVVWLIGAYALVSGVARVLLALRLRKWERGHETETIPRHA